MTASTPVVLPPVGVRGMKVLQREKFSRKMQVPVLKVKEEIISKIPPLCKPYFLKLEHFKPVQNSENDMEFKKYLFLNPEKISKWEDITEKERLGMSDFGVTESNLIFKEVEFGYENWNFDTIFKAVLPENEETVSSFSQIGHIIHLNLRDHLLAYSPVIGQVLVDKIKTCRTVVNKSNIIDNTYRNFSMEVIAGEEDFIVSVIENNTRFKFDFSKVYWNPRLCKEHERILSYFKPGDILFDVFCGVGPFSIPAAKRQCTVYANDLNPEAFKWLQYNVEMNKINKQIIKCFNLDGKYFICDNFRNFIIECCKGNENIENARIHIAMNLPAMAVEFLKYFRGLITDQSLRDTFKCDITVYVYCFVEDNPVNSAKDMVNTNLGCDMTPYITDVFNVRKVSPKKEMMRVTFKLTKQILFAVSCDSEEPPLKKLCVSNS